MITHKFLLTSPQCKLQPNCIIFTSFFFSQGSRNATSGQIGIQSFNEPSFQVTNEYDPHWPNEYHKVIQGNRINI